MYEVKKVKLDNGQTIAYRMAGDGEVKLLLIHGNQCSSTIYEDFMKRYEDLATVYAIDLPGFGDSSYISQYLDMGDWAKDTKNFMDKVGIEDAIVVGHSAGGGVGLKLASDYPEKVRHLVLIASVGVKGFYLPKLNSDFTPIKCEFAYTYEEIKTHPSMIFVQNTIESRNVVNTEQMRDASLYNLRKPDKETYKTYMESFFKERCFIDISAALCQFNITNEKNYEMGDGSIENITCPVTWFHGKKDLVVPYEIGLESVKYFPNGADLITIEDGGHMLYNDCPEEFYGHMDKIVNSYRN